MRFAGAVLAGVEDAEGGTEIVVGGVAVRLAELEQAASANVGITAAMSKPGRSRMFVLSSGFQPIVRRDLPGMPGR